MTGNARPTPVRVLVIGAGGHAAVCVEALTAHGAVVVGVVAADGRRHGSIGAPLVGRDDDVEEHASRLGVDRVCVAIGDNEARRRVGERVQAAGLQLARVVSPHAVISTSAEVGPGVQLLPAAVVNAGVRLGTGAVINTAASVDHDCAIGDYAHIAPGSVLGGAVEVGAGALVGLGSRILPGLRIGASAVVGGGAVVTRAVADGAVVVGVPARTVGSRGLDDHALRVETIGNRALDDGDAVPSPPMSDADTAVVGGVADSAGRREGPSARGAP